MSEPTCVVTDDPRSALALYRISIVQGRGLGRRCTSLATASESSTMSEHIIPSRYALRARDAREAVAREYAEENARETRRANWIVPTVLVVGAACIAADVLAYLGVAR
jgi:hypothetical protein